LDLSLLDQLSRRECWEKFYEYKTSLACPKAFAGELRAFIDKEGYLPVCRSIEAGEPFPLPRRTTVSKLDSGKKRVVYTYPRAENTVLKLLTWLLLRKYDGLFADNLYSFRPGRTAKDAIRALCRVPGLGEMWAYKADVSNYFNSIPIPRLTPMLEDVLGEDGRLCAFLNALLREEWVLSGAETVREQKGVMAGTPLSAFYANLYLRSLDACFAARGVPYARYSDDIILFAPSRAGAEALAGEVRSLLAEHGLSLNPAKEELFDPAGGWVFLGFRCRGGEVDIAPASLEKIKAKMRRKARALMRWRERNGCSGERAAGAFIRAFNRKLLESPPDNDLCWGRWFFPLLTTADSLRSIDRYAQDCLRWLISGKRTKGRFDVRYEELKRLGYRSLVHEYYAFSEEER
jgi:hypothetical protein